MASLGAIASIGVQYEAVLREKAGIRSAEALLRVGAIPEGRKYLEERTGLSSDLILKWINLVDLLQIKGIGEEYCTLLAEASVSTLEELQRCDPEDLYQKIIEVNLARRLVRRLPTLAMVTRWVAQAKQSASAIVY